MYKCKHCSYTSRRAFDLRRHERRKTPCSPNLANTNTTNAVEAEGQNVIPEGQNVIPEGQNVIPGGQNVIPEGQNVIPNDYIDTQSTNYCDKCKKTFSCKKSFNRHYHVCRGVESTVCNHCLKRFSTYKGRLIHNKKVQCIAPIMVSEQPSSSQKVFVNNTTNNNINIDNSQNINITLNFGEEALEKLCNQPDYLKRMEEIVRLGKYALPQHLSDIYFNDSFPMNNTIMKTRHNDRFVKIKTGDNQWNLRAMDDVYKSLTQRMESYMNPYFKHVERQMEKIYDEDQQKFKRLTRNIREFGHKVLWLDWKCDDIRQIGVELNDPYCENERHRRIQEMKTLLLEHVYDKTKEMLELN